MTTYVNGHRVIPTTEYADNLLKVLKVAISTPSTFRPITAGEDPSHEGRVRLTFKTENAWAWWVTKLGESPFAPEAAVRVPVNGEWVHRWMSSDAGIVCEHFEVSHTTDTFRSHP